MPGRFVSLRRVQLALQKMEVPMAHLCHSSVFDVTRASTPS